MPVADLPLRDIHLPEAIGWWPPAPGWWLILVMIPLLLGMWYWLYKRLTRKTVVKTARQLLKTLKNDPSLDDRAKIAQLSALLRRVAVSIDARAEVAGLTGQDWLHYLDRSLKGAPFSEGPGRVFLDMPYRKAAPFEPAVRDVFQLCEDWLKAQRKRKK
ncbi:MULTISPECIES: DUF4381 domain-containing protein [Methylomicrobium]|uniref:DUF4381 domain-containing protein n=1 Tax=Methylomicrobium album BG8 TaxID=686340 RepID=H8GKH9_METAL|nr:MULTISPECIES: DUF4381 domain-containing protein [Methylomicrobium]EIC27987.1 hypothetical protein Metal_0118 [Methylomicrobium album BG8]